MTNEATYGKDDATYQAAGQRAGICALVGTFFDIMSSNPAYRRIYDMHPPNNEVSRDKLALFLCGWMGGPRFFVEKYGSVSIPGAHAHLDITEVERDMWLSCMREALVVQDYSPALQVYLLEQLAFPAERVREACSRNQK